jgi:hypothetical protein
VAESQSEIDIYKKRARERKGAAKNILYRKDERETETRPFWNRSAKFNVDT